VRYTQYLIFELGSKCNLDKEHWGRCPSGDLDRYGALDTSHEMSDELILQTAQKAHEMGFTGRIGFHYYNEPTIQWNRLLDLKSKIESAIPSQTFVLWTNGLNLRKLEQAPAEAKPHFTDIVISNYFQKDWSWVAPYCDRLEIGSGLLDGRKWPTRQESRTFCLRPFNEMIFDNYANAHLCCADWQGTSSLGSLYHDSFENILERFQRVRTALIRTTIADPDNIMEIPPLCARCRIKQLNISGLAPEVSNRIYQELFSPQRAQCL
jgi:hypothetical protein